jgi:hypothetical protein
MVFISLKIVSAGAFISVFRAITDLDGITVAVISHNPTKQASIIRIVFNFMVFYCNFKQYQPR